MEQLQLQDVYAEMAMAIQQYGVRKVFTEFKEFYPAFFNELIVQLPRIDKKPVAALLRK